MKTKAHTKSQLTTWVLANFFSSIFFLWGQDPVAAKVQSVVIPNPSFETTAATGKIGNWQAYAWSRPQEGIQVTSGGEAKDGQKCLGITAVDKGAAGAISEPVVIDKKARVFRLKLWVKRSAEYSGNSPWVFLSFHQGGKFLKTLDAKMKLEKKDVWESQTAYFFDDEIPGDATELRINLTSSGNSGAGTLSFDGVEMDASPDETVFGGPARSPFTLRSASVGNWVSHGEPSFSK